MTITTKNVADENIVYTMFRSEGSKAIYIGPDHSDLSKDQLILSSTSPKTTKDSFGNRRSVLNHVVTVKVPVPGDASATVSRDMKIEINCSLPAGVTESVFAEALKRVGELAAQNTTIKNLLVNGQIEY